jgi:hypothetical protein
VSLHAHPRIALHHCLQTACPYKHCQSCASPAAAEPKQTVSEDWTKRHIYSLCRSPISARKRPPPPPQPLQLYTHTLHHTGSCAPLLRLPPAQPLPLLLPRLRRLLYPSADVLQLCLACSSD